MMTEGGFYQQKRLSPTGITVVVLLHAAAVAGLITIKMEPVRPIDFGHTIMNSFPLPKDPPPPPPPQTPRQPSQPAHESTIDRVPTPIPLPPMPGPTTDPGPNVLDFPKAPVGPIPVPPPPPPPVAHDPVRTVAVMDGRSALQPPYPASAQREGAEGFVQIRIAIGADGRVKSVEKVKASRDDFFAATERQALRYWRFKPATVDGKPIESSKVLSVTFRLDELNG
jgi:protein TonB